MKKKLPFSNSFKTGQYVLGRKRIKVFTLLRQVSVLWTLWQKTYNLDLQICEFLCPCCVLLNSCFQGILWVVLINQKHVLVFLWFWNCLVNLWNFIIKLLVGLFSRLFICLLSGYTFCLFHFLLHHLEPNCVWGKNVEWDVFVIGLNCVEKCRFSSCWDCHGNE